MKVIRSIEVNEFLGEVNLTLSDSEGVDLVETLILRNPDGAVNFHTLLKGFEVLGSYDGYGLTVGRKGDFHITFAYAASVPRAMLSSAGFAQKYRGVSFPGVEA